MSTGIPIRLMSKKQSANNLGKIWYKGLSEENIKSGFEAAKGIKRKRPFTVAVEGNIGSGKSTFLNYFSKLPNVLTFEEPIDKWTNVSGNNLLQMLYEDPSRWSFLFQSYVQLTRLNIHLQNSNSDAGPESSMFEMLMGQKCAD
ncbi:Deoxynucleoside kinase [Armadillidium vulgare]|nr:Deoxynucleoside kinase [Armadillidium vulgare]